MQLALSLFGYDDMDAILMIVALVGTGLFVVKLALMIIGMDADADVDFDAGIDTDVDAIGDGFHLLSFQGIMSFLMMFGWVGLALHNEAGWGELASFGGAFAAGFVAMVLFALVMMQMKKLQHSGNIVMKNAIGRDGTVYLTIKPGDTGKVRVPVQGSLRIFNAVTESRDPIPTGEHVKVTNVIGGNVLVVEKV
jgi:membrane protein implicated in regulation of membrane protease activity